jgi:hypothetical protein
VVGYAVTGRALTAVAYVTKGPGDVAEAEITRIVGPAVFTERGDRYTMFRTTTGGITDLLAQARTIDDLRAVVAGPGTARPTRI